MEDTSKTMKLYVWEEPYPVNYGSSLVIAMAHSLREARKEAQKAKTNYTYYSIPANLILGKPTRVHTLPCAEWYHWEE